MRYRTDKKTGNELSILGFGCMRFPWKMGRIDIAGTERLITRAVNEGINYFDTAYIYGKSEEVLGQIIEKNNLREKIFLATKLPIGKCAAAGDFETLFGEQLKRLRTDYIDYYLIHNLSDLNLWNTLCELGIEEWLAEKKAAGIIKSIGFSFHGMQKDFMELLDAYTWDFCQIQYNYLNVNYQAGEAGLKKAAAKGLPVIIMEPLLGGKLANGLPAKAVKIFKSRDSSRTPAEWALRWLWNHDEVTMVLSGMNEMPQLTENVLTAQTSVAGTLNDDDNKMFQTVVGIVNDTYKIPCTGCNYCMPCPMNINIPGCFAAYNTSYTLGLVSGFQQYMTGTGATDPRKNYTAGKCVECGKCEQKCPQHIPIRSSLKNVVKRLEPFWFRTMVAIFVKLRG